MSATTVIDNAHVTLWYHPEAKIVHSKIHKFVSGKEFREFLMTGKNVLVKHGARKWLSDDSSNTVIRKEDIDWGNANWFPECVAHGWKYWAIVKPQVLAQSRMEELVVLFSSHGVTSQFFDNVNDAMRWLERQA